MRQESKSDKRAVSDEELIEKVVCVKRVTKVVKGGRRFSFSALAVVGNQTGKVGHGLGKANEVTDAISKAVEAAKKSMITVPIAKSTVPHEAEARYDGARVLIKPASQGTGIIAGGTMRAVFEAVGIKDILAKSKGSSNPHNVVKATFKGLKTIRSIQMVARQRGVPIKKIITG